MLPLLGRDVFGLDGFAIALTFLVAFGVAKALSNLAAGALADRFGRRPVLIAGWLIGIPVPLLLIWAPSWAWVVVANVLLGVNQGSHLVDHRDHEDRPGRPDPPWPGPGAQRGRRLCRGRGDRPRDRTDRGRSRSRPALFYLGLAIAGLGLGVSVPFVRRRRGMSSWRADRATAAPRRGGTSRCEPPGGIGRSRRHHRPASSTTSTTAWRGGCCRCTSPPPVCHSQRSASWWRVPRGLGHRPGRDRRALGPRRTQEADRRRDAAPGRIDRGASPWPPVSVRGSSRPWVSASARRWSIRPCSRVVADVAAPAWRASALGVYRLWRDLGFAIGAILAGVLADAAWIFSDPCGGRVDGCLRARRPRPDARDAAASRGRSGRSTLPSFGDST